MSRVIVLDSGPLGLLTNPKDTPQTQRCQTWMTAHITAGNKIAVAEINDYEVRRELIRSGKTRGLSLLDNFLVHPNVTYLPLTTSAMRRAAALWASARQGGQPTADPHALDGDVILAAQVLEAYPAPLGDDGVTVATTNARHLTRFVPADLWQNLAA